MALLVPGVVERCGVCAEKVGVAVDAGDGKRDAPVPSAGTLAFAKTFNLVERVAAEGLGLDVRMRLFVVRDGADDGADPDFKAIALLLEEGLHLQPPAAEFVGDGGDEMAVQHDVRDGVDGIEVEDDGGLFQQTARHVESAREDPVLLSRPLACGLIEALVEIRQDGSGLKGGVVVAGDGGGALDLSVA